MTFHGFLIGIVRRAGASNRSTAYGMERRRHWRWAERDGALSGQLHGHAFLRPFCICSARRILRAAASILIIILGKSEIIWQKN